MLKNLLKILFGVISILKLAEISSHKCVHDQIKAKPKINTAIQNDQELRFLQSTPWTPIKIYIDYTYLDSQKTVDANMIALAKKVITNTVNIYSNILSVQRANRIIRLIETCDPITVQNMKNEITTSGIDTDIIIFPFFDTAAEKNTEAYASPCSMDPRTKRPIAGVMAFNPRNFNFERKNALEYYTMLVLHEINHILCFSESLYDYYVDSSYNILDKTKVYANMTINDVVRTVIVTPKVVETARKHFGCSSIAGVELEDQGGSGTARSHWESRVALGDFMMGETYPENVISEITLALFEDSGWYKVNYYTGGLFRYGKNKGCDFVQKKCINDQKSNFPNDFCTIPDAPICFPSRTSKGLCDIGQRTTIPKAYQYFSDPQFGGYLYADFCPVPRWEKDETLGVFFSSSCIYGVSEYDNLGETIGSNSNCFMTSLIPKDLDKFNDYKGKTRAICYGFSCNSADQTYSVKLLNNTITCPKAGGVKTVDGMDGSFYCADYNTICTKSVDCKDSIECALNKSSYNFKSYDYSVDSNANAPLTNGGNSGTTINTSTNSNNNNQTPTSNNSSSGEFSKLFNIIYVFLFACVFVL